MSDAPDPPPGDDHGGDPFAPATGWRVRILDLSGGNPDTDDVVEEIDGFPTMVAANAFARAYVRDSVERCREPGMSAAEIAKRWFAWGEDARVVDPDGVLHDGGWRSERELDRFAATRAGAIERDWRALDPRRNDEGDDDDTGGDPEPRSGGVEPA